MLLPRNERAGFRKAVAAVALLFSLAVLVSRLRATEEKSAADTAESHVGKGYEDVQNDRFREAAREFQAALELNPRLLRARYQLAVCYFALGERKESRQEFERLRQETKSDSSVVYYLGRLDLAEGDTDSAIRRLRSVAADPPFPDTAYYLGSAYLKKGEFLSAEKWLLKAAELAPRDFRVHDHLARVYQRSGRRAEAEKQYALSEDMRQHYNEASRQAVACSQELETRTLEEARATCRQLLDPNDADKLTTLGMIYGQHAFYAEAIGPLEQAARLDPDSSEIQHNLGLTYFRLRRFAEARAPLEKAVRLRPDFFGSNALLGAALYALKEDARAYQVLEHSQELNPQDADTAQLLFTLAVHLAQQKSAAKEYAESVSYLKKAAELRPGDSQIHRRLAEVYLLLRRRSEAEREKREAERLEAPRP